MILASARRSLTAFPIAFLLGTSMILSGCKQAAAPAPGVRNADGSITNADGSVTFPAGTTPPGAAPAPPAPTPTRNADGSVTNPDGSVTYPAGSNRAQQAERGPEPKRERQPEQSVQSREPATPPRSVTPVMKVVPSGTAIPVTLTQTLSASKNNAGDTFTGVLGRDVTTAGGQIAFRRGTEVGGVVTAAKGKGRFKGAGDLAIQITSIGGTRVSTTAYEAASKGRGKRTAGIIGGGTGLGAIIGGLAGGGKGALIGGLAGAGAGTAGAAYTGGRDVVIASETPLTFTLTAAASVR